MGTNMGLPAAVVVIVATAAATAYRNALGSDVQVVVVVDIGPALQEEFDHVGVASSSRHGQDAGAQAVTAVDLCPVLQQDVGDVQVPKPWEKEA